MGRLTRTALATAVAGAVLVLGAGPVAATPAASAAAAAATAPAKRPPIPVAGVAGLPSPRLDQDTTQTVIAQGASRRVAVSATWGDGSVSRGVSTCSAARAVKRPASCVVTLAHTYRDAGTFPIEVRSGQRVIARTTVTVRQAPRPWSPPAGWVQPAGWSVFRGGATYAPCSTVAWHFDRSAEPAGAAGMRAEIEGALARLAEQTGLAFVETAEPSAAGLTFSWGDLSDRSVDAAGVGGRTGRQGFVTFSTTHWWPTDQWPGYGVVVQPNGTYAIGRGWLVVHETMHALGMDHVADPAAVMNPYAGATQFSAGDLDGLRTMYLDNACAA